MISLELWGISFSGFSLLTNNFEGSKIEFYDDWAPGPVAF